MGKNGIDVSEWQGDINWEQVRPDIDFAIIRLGSGQGSPDACGEYNIKECIRLGIPFGVYWFSYAYSAERARNEARSAVELLVKYGANPMYGVWFDWEYDSRYYLAKKGITVSNDILREVTAAFCDEIRKAGLATGVYTNGDYIENHYGKDFLKDYDLWYAHIAKKPDIPTDIHQFSWSGKVPGIVGNVDMNKAYKEYKEEKIMYNTIEEVPEYANPTIQKLMDKGWLQGDKDGNLKLTEEMCRMFVVNDRAGVYG